MALTDKDYEKMAQMTSFLAGVVKLAAERGYDASTTTALVKKAAVSFSETRFGENLIEHWSRNLLTKSANGMGAGAPPIGGGMGGMGSSPTQMAPAGTDPNAMAKQQGPGGANGMEDPEDAALRSKPVPTNPFDFRNHPAILQMQKRQKDLLMAKKKELEQAQNHTSGLF
jgi:hypothetical protein